MAQRVGLNLKFWIAVVMITLVTAVIAASAGLLLTYRIANTTGTVVAQVLQPTTAQAHLLR